MMIYQDTTGLLYASFAVKRQERTASELQVLDEWAADIMSLAYEERVFWSNVKEGVDRIGGVQP